MISEKLSRILINVQRPGRYIAGEWNSVRKEWADGTVKVVLAFPDNYEVGSSHLGIKILYGMLNERKDCLCERVFAPWPDFEAALRNSGILLSSLESQMPLEDFDILGFSLAYELTYTNMINMLDLGGVPVRSSERSSADPLVIAGGPASFNPEPVSDFIDAFLIGEGEEAVPEIVECYKAHKTTVHSQQSTDKANRKSLLRELAAIKGVYVPSLYKVEYGPDGTINNTVPSEDGVPKLVEKRIVRDLDSAYYPTRQIVPNIQIVHDRIAIEVMRGCKHACRYCQASATYRPCRERSKETVVRLAKEAYASTGYDEISLLSLSSGDYSQICDVIEALNAEFSGKNVSVSVPSLRVEDILKDLPALISKVKKSGLTFAPEAGSECLRKAISKNIDIEKLYTAVSESFKNGWKRVKLYFMIGLPGETDDDILGIAEMARTVSSLKTKLDARPAQVVLSVNAFVPKPHTIFQWEGMDGMEALKAKRDLLKGSIRSRMIELDFHSFEMSYIEAAMSRGDRRLGAVIYGAWKEGARFDGWQEMFNMERWLGAFKAEGIDPDFYVTRRKSYDEILPWDHLDLGHKKEAMAREASSCRA